METIAEIEPKLEPARQKVIQAAPSDFADNQAKLATIKGGYDDATSMIRTIKGDMPRDIVKSIEKQAESAVNPPLTNEKQIAKMIATQEKNLDTAGTIEAHQATRVQDVYTQWNNAGRPKTGMLKENLDKADALFKILIRQPEISGLKFGI